MRRHETRSSSTESPFFFFPRAHTNTRTHTHEHTRVPDSTGRSFVPSTRLDSAKRSEVKCGVPPIHPSYHHSIFPGTRARPDYDYHYHNHKRRVMTRRLIASGVASAVGSTHSGSRARVVYCVFIFYTTLFIHIKNTTTTRARNTSSSTGI